MVFQNVSPSVTTTFAVLISKNVPGFTELNMSHTILILSASVLKTDATNVALGGVLSQIPFFFFFLQFDTLFYNIGQTSIHPRLSQDLLHL